MDTDRTSEHDRESYLFSEPVDVLVARTLDDVPAVLERLDGVVNSGRWAAGFVSYEAGYAFEPRLFGGDVSLPDEPLIWFGVYDEPHRLPARGAHEALRGPGRSLTRVRHLEFGCARDVYRSRVQAIRDYIYEGDVYQINFTDTLSFEVEGEPLGLYRALRARQQVSYAALINTGSEVILSLSPELFFRREGRRIWTRPMKGTARRGHSLEEDEQQEEWLAHDEKTRAENLMIVDLLRNDLSMVCEAGSVRVPALFTAERYETLFQLTSTVEGRLRETAGYADILRALFPCGSVTGAPKLRAMRRILALERRPRGVYCGAIGYIAPDNRAVFNVAIRSIVLRNGMATMGTGSGIVWDSDPDQEYEECLLKGDFLKDVASQPVVEPFDLIETMRYEHGSIALLRFHIDRLAASAAFFGRPFDEQSFLQALEGEIRSHPDEPLLVRALLHPSGDVSITARRLEDAGPAFQRVLCMSLPVNASDPFLYHKTTRREAYEAAYEQARAEGFDEVLFVNARGEVTEGSRTNLFIERDGQLLTPPVSSGLLAGVYRRHTLETDPRSRECVLRLEDLDRADGIYLCNAVRGWCRVGDVDLTGMNTMGSSSAVT